MKRILLLGNGGREHAIAISLKKSPQDIEIYGFFSANNPKIAELCTDFYITSERNFGEDKQFAELKNFASDSNIDFAILGPDDPIGAGAGDALLEIGIKSFGPTKLAAQLESSKGFTRELISKNNIDGNPEFKCFLKNSEDELQEYIESIPHKFVIKDDGLCGGKGVSVQDDHFNTKEEGIALAKNMLAKSGSIVIEEKMEGPEFSLMFIADGKTILPTPTIADHKRAYEGDTGPNTGGMGTISFSEKLPFITDENISEATQITQEIMEAIKEETGETFCGVMYGGFMRTKTGTKVIEYNARFGDPESLNFFSLLESDFVEICEKTINQQLHQTKIVCTPKATVCKYLVPEGYPSNSVKNKEIKIDEKALSKIEGIEVYYASVYEDDNNKLMLGGSRAIGIVGIDADFETAKQKANEALKCVSGPVWAREDIGNWELVQKRIDMCE